MMALKEEYSLDIDEIVHMRKIFKNLDSMRKQRKYCDIIINVEGKQIHANRDILCAASDYFNAMFSHDTTEKKNGIVEMQGVSYIALQKCVNFIYTGKLSTCEKGCEELLYAATLLQLVDVCDKIQPFLVSTLDCKSVFAIRKIGEKFSLPALTARCDNFAIDNLQSVAGNEHFAELDYEYVSHLLRSSAAIADSKLSIGLKWMNHNPKDRDAYLMEMVSSIDMSKISRAYCRQLAESEPLCKRSAEFMTKIVLALTAPEKPVVADREEHSVKEVISSHDSLILFHDDTIRTYILDDKHLKRQEFSSPVRSEVFSTCVFGKDVYAILWNSTQIYALNTESWKWRQLSDSNRYHDEYLQCVAHDGKIYVGWENQLQRFDIALDEWQAVDLDSTVCDLSSLVVYKNRLYIIGGLLERFGIRAVSSCSLDLLLWEKELQLCIARHSSSATVLNDRIYVAGGESFFDLTIETVALYNFEMYDDRTKTWTELPQMLNPRTDFRLLVVNQKLCAVGCGTGRSCIDVFDPEEWKWSDHPNKLFRDISIAGMATVSFHAGVR